MPTANLSFAKIVATPTVSAWSQAYNAGGLFIALSLATDDEQAQEELPITGKKILDTIEAEYFGLEKKDLSSIQEVIAQSVAELNPLILPSLSLTSIKDNVLYGFLIGDGRLTLKRGEKVGVILENDDTKKDPLENNAHTTKTASGYLENDDIILIQTAQFADHVPAKIIMPALEYNLPSDIAETITPFVHGKTEGGATAIVLCYKGFAHEPVDEMLPANANPPLIPTSESPSTNLSEKTQQPDVHSDLENSDKSSFMTKLATLVPKIPFSLPPINRRKKMILAVALILFGLLIMSIFFVQSSSKSSESRQLFDQIYNSAKKSYDEGEGLLSLNKSLARDDYTAAKAELEKGVGAFKPGSQEQKKIDELRGLIDKRLTELEGVSKATAREVDGKDQPSLLALVKNSSILSSVQDDTTTYTLSSKAIASITSSDEKKDLIKNDSNWSSPKSIGFFTGNFYILDPKSGLLKFVPTSSAYEESTYFKGDAPDLKDAVSMAIDGSIFILFSDGTVQKYTRGVKDSFSITDMPKNVTKPGFLYTSAEVDNLYIVDTGSNSLLKFDKSGKFQSQYQADVFKNTKAFMIADDESSAFVLSGGKIYELSL